MFVIQFFQLFFYRQRFVNVITGFPVSTETRPCFVLFIFHSFFFSCGMLSFPFILTVQTHCNASLSCTHIFIIYPICTDALQCVSILRIYLSFTSICADAWQSVSILRIYLLFTSIVQTHGNASLSCTQIFIIYLYLCRRMAMHLNHAHIFIIYPYCTDALQCVSIMHANIYHLPICTDALQCVSIMHANIYHFPPFVQMRCNASLSCTHIFIIYPYLYRRIAMRLYHAHIFIIYPYCTDALQCVSIIRASMRYHASMQCNASILLNFPYPQFLQIFKRTIIIFCLTGMIFGIIHRIHNLSNYIFMDYIPIAIGGTQLPDISAKIGFVFVCKYQNHLFKYPILTQHFLNIFNVLNLYIFIFTILHCFRQYLNYFNFISILSRFIIAHNVIHNL